MITIPQKPRESRTLAYIKTLPLLLQIIIVIFLLVAAWQFRFYQTGVDPDTLTKVQGVLYEVSCLKSIQGSDTIQMRTSIRNDIVTFSGWQKCDNVNWLLVSQGKNFEAIFYTRNYRHLYSKDSVDGLYVFAVDLVYPQEQKFIYPARGLGIENNPNIFGMFLLFMAVLIVHSMWGDYSEKRKKKKIPREQSD